MRQTIQDKNPIVTEATPNKSYEKDLAPIKGSNMPVYYKGNGREYTSYRAMRRGELAKTFTIKHDETGKRFEKYLTAEEIEIILDQQLGQSQEEA